MKNLNVPKRTRWSVLITFAITGLVTILGFQNCGKIGSSAGSSAELNSSAGGAGGVNIQISQPPAQTANLGTQLTIPITVTAPGNYSGTLKLNVLTPELSILDPGAGIQFSFQPPTLAFTGGGTGQSTLTVNVTSISPSFDLSQFHVQAVDSTNSAAAGEVSVALQVKAVFNVQLFGPAKAGSASPENWSVPIGSVTKFISHQEGMTITFQNMDSAQHYIHSGGGPILHETGPNLAASPDGGKTVGGSYTTLVPAGTTTLTSQTYCHIHEGGAQLRSFQFNVPVKPVSTTSTPSGNPNAKFAFINANVIQTSCIGCHSAGAANQNGGGVDLSSYAMVMTHLKASDAMLSEFYIAIAPPNPVMPKGGTPLSAALVKDISDWINDGALNN